MTAPTSNNEVTARRLSSVITGLWNKIKTALDGKASSTHSHGNIANGGTLTDTAAAAAGNDYVVIRDADNAKIQTSTIKGTDVADAVSKKHSHSTLTLSTTAQAYDGSHTLALPATDPYTSARTPASHTHGNITNGGALQTTDVAIANGDKLVVTDASDSNKVARASVSFDGSTTTKALTPKGTFEAFAKAADITSAIQALDVSSVGGAGKYISAISETDGKISATATTMDTAPTASSTNAVTSGGVKTALDAKANDSAVVHIAGQEYITGEKCYKGGMGIVNSYHVGYVFFSIPPNDFGTKYENWDSSLKDGAHFREWRLCFPTGASYWGKIRITIGGNYFSFNASGVMSKTLNIAFNTRTCYLNVGAYDALGYNVEKEFRISDLVWNSTDARWEIIIHSIKPTSNNSFYFTNIELWSTFKSYLDYGRQINWVSTSPSIVTDTTYTNAWRNITFNWADQPVLQSPYGNSIFDDSMTISVANGGTGKTSVTANSFLVGNGTSAMVEKTPAEVRSLIGAGTSSLALGETSSTAYRGDRGKTAYDHSQATHAPTTSAAAASGGTTLSLVTTGEKYTWNNKSTLALGETSSTAYRGDRGKTAYDHSQATHAPTTSAAAASGGTTLSLVTTGEKYTWNSKSDLTIGTTATTAAAGNHTHTLTLASGGTSTVDLSANTAYTLTAGGKSIVFKTPADNNTDTKQRIVASTAKTYLTGVTTAPTSSNQDLTGVASTKVYATDGVLTATSFSGNLTGNVTGNCSGSSGSCTGNAATATTAAGYTNDGAIATALGNKVDKVSGKGLSTNDFTSAYKSNVDSNTNARHTHSNKSLLDGIVANNLVYDCGTGSTSGTDFDNALAAFNAGKWVIIHDSGNLPYYCVGSYSGPGLRFKVLANETSLLKVYTLNWTRGSAPSAGTQIEASLVGHTHTNYVPTSRTINGAALTDNLSAADIGLPSTWSSVSGPTYGIALDEGGIDASLKNISPSTGSMTTDTYFLVHDAIGESSRWYARKINKLWDWIKDKIASVLRLYTRDNDTPYFDGLAANAVQATKTTNADITRTADTTNGDKLQIGSGTAVNITNAAHAKYADDATSAGEATYATSSGKAYEDGNGTTLAPLVVQYQTGSFPDVFNQLEAAYGSKRRIFCKHGLTIAGSYETAELKIPLSAVRFSSSGSIRTFEFATQLTQRTSSADNAGQTIAISANKLENGSYNWGIAFDWPYHADTADVAGSSGTADTAKNYDTSSGTIKTALAGKASTSHDHDSRYLKILTDSTTPANFDYDNAKTRGIHFINASNSQHTDSNPGPYAGNLTLFVLGNSTGTRLFQIAIGSTFAIQVRRWDGSKWTNWKVLTMA